MTNKPLDGFIENKGQISDQNNNPNPAVLYLLNTPGFNVQLRKGGFSYDMYAVSHQEPQQESPTPPWRLASEAYFPGSLSLRGEEPGIKTMKFHRIDFDLIGSNPNYEILTSEPSIDYLNYYTVGTPEKGVTSVRSYKKITYKDIYPGIDVEFLVDENHRFEYNFLVHPGGNIASLQIQILGPQKIIEIPNGLSLKTTIGIIDELIPLCFYRMYNKSFPVKGNFSEKGQDIYGFILSENIPEYAELIIDPIPTRRWGTYYGGDDGELIFNNSCAVDNLGNVLLGGSTNSLSNIATLGAFQTVLGGGTDGFLAKFNATGQRMWATYYGGNAGDRVDACAVDQWGNIFIAGFTSSNSNIASPGAFQTVLRGGIDSFVAKFDPAGIRLWGTYYGGNEIQPLSGDWFQACETDTSGSIYCAGETGAPDFIATPGALQTTLFGLRDGFLVKFTGEGERVWATYYGGSGMEENTGCTVSKNGLVYLSGTTESPENIATPGSFLPTLGSSPKGFLACFNLDGQRLWGTYFGGDGSDESYGCAADTGSHVYLYGVTNSLNNIATPGVYQAAKIGTGTDAFLNKFNSSGGRLWGTYFGAGSTDIQGAAVDDSGYVYVTGISNTQDTLIFSPSAYLTIKRGEYGNAVLAKFTGTGDRVWSTYYGGTVIDRGVACAVDMADNIYLAGNTWSPNNKNTNGLCTRTPLTNYIASPSSYQSNLDGVCDGFLVKFADCYSPDTALQIYGPSALCQNSTGVVFSIDPLITATDYHWCVTGNLTISSGQGTTSITLDVGPATGIDTISVYGINACDTGFPKLIVRQVYPRPSPVIIGSDTTCTGAIIQYSTSGGSTGYQWTISPGGSIVSGGSFNDSTCTITWNSGGSQWIRVNYTDTNGCNGLNPTQFNVWVIEGPEVDISISASANPICLGALVNFTSIAINGGTFPVYQWKINGINVGSNQPAYAYIPTDGDIVTCTLTSSLVCNYNNSAMSNSIVMVVNSFLSIAVDIIPSETPTCEGDSVTFSANTINGGSSPDYQWQLNGMNVGINSSDFTYIPMLNDQVTCILTSSEPCTYSNPVSSIPVIMEVLSLLPVSITILASSNPVCGGIPITLTGASINGGSAPVYQWQVNGINTGTNNPDFTYTPVNGDFVTCTLISNEECITNNPATSNSITMSVGEAPDVSFTVCFDTITTLSAKPFKLKGGVPLGGTYSGPGVDQITGYFNPAMAGVGLKTISYSYTNLFNCSNNATRAISVINPAPFSCGDSLTDIRDNKKYSTIQLGSQCWLAMNLNHGQQIGGTLAQRDNCLVEKYCYNDFPANCNQYGALYQWDELMRYEDTEEIQGLCPPVWRVPSEADWDQLFAVFQGNAFAGSPLLYTGYSGFNVLLAGVEFFNQSNRFVDFASIMWSSTSHGPYKAWSHGLNEYNYSVSYYPSYRSNAFSVRCLRE